MLGHYKNLLTYIKSAVTKNYAEKSINSILDYVSTSKRSELLLQFYQITLEALAVNYSFFKTNLLLILDCSQRSSLVQNEHQAGPTLL